MAVKTRSFGLVRLFDEPLFRLIAINGAAGIVIAILVLAGIFWSNIGNLRNLVLNADDPVLPVLMLAFGLVITLGSVVIGSAIMLLGKEDRGGGTAFRLPEVDKGSALQPVRVTTRSQE
ncbi:hypothetical protein IWQ55_003808 [Labrenzia sp. EL_208]|uniref:Uncharacterized protein n=1 Tax=Roseibium album TaxID=311410 RepID=A0A0M6ZHW8_9HYPH|nr:hypothetical protein [Roseibium album]MBG6155600.1 hypothetical protein [Labrenzia sp. EL_162]MBG6161055.1 hypothetical protein [Labrenzia sp. EL_195]MBG6175970.1 hypothetical protein [Labrenzia sp. EL_132]MBG6194134.1 hypothetical protein [Labrenzia sp. EL_159]MBG6200891.1 hypothetical protein [Labrenzia sp. EL_13]MBG6230585.1 hypothetical protein [Labrenzia sp. EL_208]